MAVDKTYFINTMPWAGIRDVIIDGQEMVKIPKFYVRCFTPSTGSYVKKVCREISDTHIPGFHVHPAFMYDGKEMDCFYIGKYECTDDGGTKAGSIKGVMPLVNIDQPALMAKIAARGEGLDGWHLWNIYELAALQTLVLIELGRPDTQTAIGIGNSKAGESLALTGSTDAVYRGIYELWGNAWHFVNGLTGKGENIQIFDKEGKNQYSYDIPVVCGTGYVYEMYTGMISGFDFSDIYMPSAIVSSENGGTYSTKFNKATYEYEAATCWQGGGLDGSRGNIFSLFINQTPNTPGKFLTGRLAKYPQEGDE